MDTPDELIQEIKALRKDVQDLPYRITKSLIRELIFLAAALGALVLLNDLWQWIHKNFLR
jgi:hypothetical protein